MRLNLNLAVHQSAHERYALYWAPPVALGAVIALVYLTTFARRTIRQYNQVRRSVAECHAQEDLLRAREMAALHRLQQPQFQRVLRQASYVNSLIDQRQLSLTALTAKLVRLLPADVRITTLSLSAGSDGPSVRMTIESSTQEKVIEFVQSLEESSDFTDAAISSEDPGQESSEGASGGVARVIWTARYAGWRNPEATSGEKKEDSDEDEAAFAGDSAKKMDGDPKAPAATEGGSSKQKAVGSKQKAVGTKQ
jgi:Tfp pilus assembly protein PilN